MLDTCIKGAWPVPETPVFLFLLAGKVGINVYDEVRCALDGLDFGGNS